MFRSILANRTSRFAVIAGVGLALTWAPIGVATAEPSCSDVLFVGARGSGQPAAGSSGDGGSGMGPQVYSAYQRLVSDVPQVSVTGVAVDYPARTVESGLIDPTGYLDGLQDGVQGVKRTLRVRAKECPNQSIVLGGYSQGAMVMHRVVQDLLDHSTASSRSILRRVQGVILLADGDRLRRDGVTDLGSAGPSRGISYTSADLLGARGTRLPPRFRPRVFSVCAAADVVCDYHALLQSDSNGNQGTWVHANSYTGSPPVLQAADAVAARLS